MCSTRPVRCYQEVRKFARAIKKECLIEKCTTNSTDCLSPYELPYKDVEIESKLSVKEQKGLLASLFDNGSVPD